MTLMSFLNSTPSFCSTPSRKPCDKPSVAPGFRPASSLGYSFACQHHAAIMQGWSYGHMRLSACSVEVQPCTQLMTCSIERRLDTRPDTFHSDMQQRKVAQKNGKLVLLHQLLGRHGQRIPAQMFVVRMLKGCMCLILHEPPLHA